MWEKFLAEVKSLFSSQRSEVRADVKAEIADALKANSTLNEVQGQLAAAKSDLASKTSMLDGLVTAVKSALATHKVECKSEVPSEMFSALTAKLSGDLATANASITSISSERDGFKTGKDAAESAIAAQKLGIARECLKTNAVAINGADGKPLAKECSDADLTAACKDMTFESLVTAQSGAVHKAASEIGVDLKKVPVVSGAAAPGEKGKKLSVEEECRQAIAKNGPPQFGLPRR